MYVCMCIDTYIYIYIYICTYIHIAPGHELAHGRVPGGHLAKVDVLFVLLLFHESICMLSFLYVLVCLVVVV